MLLDAAFPARTQADAGSCAAVNSSRIVPGLGWIALATHTSGRRGRKICFPFDKSDDGGPKPQKREALRFASIASHNPPRRGQFAKRFSEGVFAQTEDVLLNAFTAPSSLPLMQPGSGRKTSRKEYSRNCLTITTHCRNRQPGIFSCSVFCSARISHLDAAQKNRNPAFLRLPKKPSDSTLRVFQHRLIVTPDRKDPWVGSRLAQL